jgi:hypothetical protein
MPSLAFIIVRMNWYRHLGPVIQEALNRGWRVECWHDLSQQNKLPNPDVPYCDRIPQFSNGRPRVRALMRNQEIWDLMANKAVDIIVNCVPAPRLEKYPDMSGRKRSMYVCLDANMEWQCYLKDEPQLRCLDMIGSKTPFWTQKTFELMRALPNVLHSSEVEQQLSSRTEHIGWPEIDQMVHMDRVEIRKRYGLPQDKPVVVCLNWVDMSSISLDLAWFQCESLRQKIHAAWRYRTDWRRYAKIWGSVSITDVTDVIRSFCDNNGAWLVMKNRYRDPLALAEQRVADQVICDASYYPHTMVELMKAADFCISYMSFGVREAAACRIPSVVLDVAGLSAWPSFGEIGESIYLKFLEEGSFFNFPGVVSALSGDTIESKLSTAALGDFCGTSMDFDAYFDKFIGQRGVSHTAAFLDAIVARWSV